MVDVPSSLTVRGYVFGKLLERPMLTPICYVRARLMMEVSQPNGSRNCSAREARMRTCQPMTTAECGAVAHPNRSLLPQTASGDSARCLLAQRASDAIRAGHRCVER